MDLIKVTDVQYIKDFVLRLSFSDGLTAEVDLHDHLWGEIFEPLKEDPELFRKVKLNPWTVEWPNGADFAPEFLHNLAKKQANVFG